MKKMTKKMQGGIRRFIIAALVITLVLYSMKDTSVLKDAKGEPYIEKIATTKDVSLGELVNGIQSQRYEKIKIINDTLVQGYMVTTGAVETVPSMSLQKSVPVKTYTIETSEKPIRSTLQEIGISLTGSTEILVETQSENTLTRIFIDQILPTLFFFAAIIFFFKMFGPKGGTGGMPFNIKVGKLKGKSEVETKFKDVAGMDECKEELVEIVDFLKAPDKYKKAGARVPK
jgi:ATP-dependent Zn protease